MANPIWCDAHLDLAYFAVNGRDMLAALDRNAGPHAPASVTLPSLREGNVRIVLATIFTEPGGDTTQFAEAYAEGDFDRAHVVGRAQLEAYLTWRDRGEIVLDRFASLGAGAAVGSIRGGMGVAELVPLSAEARLSAADRARTAAQRRGPGPIHVGILIENADPIRSPGELAWWVERGVVAIGLAWARSSRYAGGNTSTDGLSSLGKELVGEMDRLGVVHDASHLSDVAFDDLCSVTSRRIIASHSNSRAITDPSGKNQRHLTDAQIREIVRRDGVIGLNVLSTFLRPGIDKLSRATIDDAIRHIEHVCELAGDRAHVGLGSDMDGGFAADRMPVGIDAPRDLVKLAEALHARGWSDAEVNGFTSGNWLRVFG